MERSLIKNMCLAAMFIAIAYVLTAFAQISYATGGYLNFGDAIIIFSSIILGPYYGAFVGMIAGGLADLTLGGFLFIPFTIVAKGGEALIVGLLHKKLNKKIKWLSYVLGAIWMIVIYFFCYLILYGPSGLVGSAFDLIQGSVAVILAIILETISKRIKLFNKENT